MALQLLQIQIHSYAEYLGILYRCDLIAHNVYMVSRLTISLILLILGPLLALAAWTWFVPTVVCESLLGWQASSIGCAGEIIVGSLIALLIPFIPGLFMFIGEFRRAVWPTRGSSPSDRERR